MTNSHVVHRVWMSWERSPELNPTPETNTTTKVTPEIFATLALRLPEPNPTPMSWERFVKAYPHPSDGVHALAIAAISLYRRGMIDAFDISALVEEGLCFITNYISEWTNVYDWSDYNDNVCHYDIDMGVDHSVDLIEYRVEGGVGYRWHIDTALPDQTFMDWYNERGRAKDALTK